MRRLIFCCDGTWNQIESLHATNVLKLAKAIPPVATDGTDQIVFYLEGVGTGRGTGTIARKIDQWGGGMFGWGLLNNIISAYKQLVFNYRPDDEIYIFGFSRGAHTARSLAGLIRSVGILGRDNIHKLSEAIDRYRLRGSIGHPDTPDNCLFRWENSRSITTGRREREWRARNHPDFNHEATPALKIRYLGVWDTVGAMGVPDFLGISKFFNKRHKFHDFQLSSSVSAARHAVAIDERRATFPAAMWDNLDDLNSAQLPGEAYKYLQSWFPGGHGSVGGGGDVVGLSDDALLWVVEGALTQGLEVDSEFLAQARKHVDHKVHLNNISDEKRSFASIVMSMFKKDRDGPHALHDVSLSTKRRWKDEPAYRPKSLARVGGELDRWNEVL